MVLLVSGAYAVAMVAAARVVDGHWHVLAVRFAHTLVPIAFAYVVAHYFSLLLIEGQYGISAPPTRSAWTGTCSARSPGS